MLTRFTARFFVHAPVRPAAREVHREWLRDLRRAGVLIDDSSYVPHPSGWWRVSTDARVEASSERAADIATAAFGAATVGFRTVSLDFVATGSA